MSKSQSLSVTHPELAKELVDTDPTTLTFGSNKKVHWVCSKKHMWNESPKKRAGRGDNCPYCSGQRVLVGFNDLATTHPELAKELVDTDPSTISMGSAKKQLWRCELGHEWKADAKHRTNDRGCPSCAQSGFDPNKESYLYFLSHQEWLMYQIGITNVPDDRLNRHRKLGWTVLELRGPMDGHLTRQWETAILRMLKAKGADLSNSKIAGKFDGYSESWSKSTFSTKSMRYSCSNSSIK
jgi:hypothetical protein